MTISKTPYRIPLSGGGTDIDFYYKKSKGHLMSVAIDQYVYVLLVPRLVDNDYLIKSKCKICNNIIYEFNKFNLCRRNLFPKKFFFY